MENDYVLTAELADQLQNRLVNVGELPVWTVAKNPSDYPGKYVARVACKRVVLVQGYLLVADDLETLREMLPRGLFVMPRDVLDDPMKVEAWI